MFIFKPNSSPTLAALVCVFVSLSKYRYIVGYLGGTVYSSSGRGSLYVTTVSIALIISSLFGKTTWNKNLIQSLAYATPALLSAKNSYEDFKKWKVEFILNLQFSHLDQEILEMRKS